MTIDRTHVIRTLLCAAALLSAAPAVQAQCTWEADVPRGRREAEEARVYMAVHEAQRGVIRSALQVAGVSDPKGIVIVTTARGGGAPVIHAVDVNFPTAVLEGVAPALLERMKELPERLGARVATVLRLDTVALPPARADGRRRDCKPSLLNRELVRNELQLWASSSPETERVPRPVMVGFALSREGRVVYAEIVRSSGREAVDQFAYALVARMVFRPAALDGVPRDVWAVLPIELR